MDKDLFEFAMKRAGYRTPKERADALGWSISYYYRRIKNGCECSKSDISKVAELLGWELAQQIFFDHEVS